MAQNTSTAALVLQSSILAAKTLEKRLERNNVPGSALNAGGEVDGLEEERKLHNAIDRTEDISIGDGHAKADSAARKETDVTIGVDVEA